MSSNGTCARFDISRRWEAFAPSVITMGELPTTAASVRDSSTRRSCIHSSAQLGRCVLDANATGTPRSASVESARRAPSKRRSVSPLEARMPPSPSSIDTHGGPLRKRGRAQSVQSRSQTTRVGSGVGRHGRTISFRCQSRARTQSPTNSTVSRAISAEFFAQPFHHSHRVARTLLRGQTCRLAENGFARRSR